MHFVKTEFIAQAIRYLSKFLQLFALLRLQQVELLSTVCKSAQADAQKAHFASAITMQAKKFLKRGVNDRVECAGFTEGL